VVVRRAGLAREHDRVVGRAVAQAAVLDEVDAAEIAPRDARLAVLPRLARESRGAEERGEERHDPRHEDQDDCSHVETSPGDEVPVAVRHRDVAFP
jgi:hypothetical protein